MIQLKIAFLDEEEAYLEQLKGYLVRKKEMFFKIWTFSASEAFLACEKQMAFDAVVMTERFWALLYNAAAERKQIFLLERAGSLPFAECLFVRKYQAAENVLGQICAMLWQENREEQKGLFEKPAELIGIYSPVHHEDQVLFGMTMAQILGEEQKVLYVNLMEQGMRMCLFFRI